MHIDKQATDLKFNVAQLLREETGARRSYEFNEKQLPLDGDLVLRDLVGSTRFTRTVSGVLANVQVTGRVDMQCTRCLAPVVYTLEVRFSDEFHSVIEVNTGTTLPTPDEEDPFFIDDSHLLDLGEAIREYGLIDLPMRQLCRPDCQGLCPTCGADRNSEVCQCQADTVDDRFAALQVLLNKQP